MGTWHGHAIPGIMFMLLGGWWASQLTIRATRCRKRKLTFYSNAVFPLSCGRCAKLPLEAVIKIVLPAMGSLMELGSALGWNNPDKNAKFNFGDMQHVTMYGFFIISGVGDILVYKKKLELLPGIEYLLLALAFTIEAMLFKFHLHGRSMLDVLVHELLLIVLAATVLVILIEMKNRTSLLAAYCRAYLVILQGVWFCQIGYILYNPIPGAKKWDGDSHESMTLAVIIFAWCCAILIALVAIICFVTRLCVNRVCTGDNSYETIETHNLESVTHTNECKTTNNRQEKNGAAMFDDAFESEEEMFTTPVQPLIKNTSIQT